MITIKILLVVPGRHFIQNTLQTFKEHGNAVETFEGETIHFELKETVANFEEVVNIKPNADVIISRGITAYKLKDTFDDIPIVDIPVQGIDLIRCLVECRQQHQAEKVGVIGSRNMIYGVEELSEIVQLPINAYIMNDQSDAFELVDQAASDGCDVILAGLKTCEYAGKRDIKNYIIRTGRESFMQALSEAKRVAVVSRKEKEKTLLHQTILNHAYEGVIAVNRSGNISVFNTAAKQILSIQEEVMGRHISDVLPKGKLREELLNDNSEGEDIAGYQSIRLNYKKINISLRQQKVGSMITFQDITGIQKMEKQIRKKIHSRYHVAKHTFDDIKYKSDVVQKVIDTAKHYSRVESNLLIFGETGTGKEIIAQSVHHFGPRKEGPFVAINCAALPEHLLESELFGYVEGAFTGAVKGGKAGYFELAHGGTIFLDEISEVSLKLQSRLLRVLQEREVIRIGDDKVLPIDIRVIAATNKQLPQMIEDGTFRKDLYYRLNVLNISLPCLAERREDIPLLVDHFINGTRSPADRMAITEPAVQAMQQGRWDGNIRELKNICERLVVLNQGETITPFHVERELEQAAGDKEAPSSSMMLSEKEHLLKTLEAVHYQKSEAAEKLGVSRTTLWRKLKKYELI